MLKQLIFKIAIPVGGKFLSTASTRKQIEALRLLLHHHQHRVVVRGAARFQFYVDIPSAIAPDFFSVPVSLKKLPRAMRAALAFKIISYAFLRVHLDPHNGAWRGCSLRVFRSVSVTISHSQASTRCKVD